MVPEKPRPVLETIAPWLNEMFGAPVDAMESMDVQDDDWAFVIKISALLEASLNALNMSKVDTRLSPFVIDLEVGCVVSGKLAWIKALDLLPKGCRDFVRVVSRFRNQLAHDIRQSSFKFLDWISTLDDGAALKDTVEEQIAFLNPERIASAAHWVVSCF